MTSNGQEDDNQGNGKSHEPVFVVGTLVMIGLACGLTYFGFRRYTNRYGPLPLARRSRVGPGPGLELLKKDFKIEIPVVDLPILVRDHAVPKTNEYEQLNELDARLHVIHQSTKVAKSFASHPGGSLNRY